MRVFRFTGQGIAESGELPSVRPASGFVWIALTRSELDQRQAEVQACLRSLGGTTLVDLHLSDLLNPHLPSNYDYTADYDLLVFRRLAHAPDGERSGPQESAGPRSPRRGGPPVLRRINTSPVGFVLFERLLLTVHPDDCAVRDGYAARLLSLAASGAREAAEPGRSTAVRFMPTNSGDLMLRLINHMVDGYLELRRELTRQLDRWQSGLLDAQTRFHDWSSLLEARQTLHYLDSVCEDQRSAIQDWLDALNAWLPDSVPGGQPELDLLKVRSRDVLEHIERVVHHVRRLEQSAEVAVQMHFSAQGHRTNEIMRVLTVLTAIFLPLNLIAGIFGMNFDFIPLLHRQAGFWWAMASMALIAMALSLYFWRKRYLEHSR